MIHQTPLFAARDGEHCLLRVEGRGTMRESPTFLAFMLQELSAPAAQALVDLTACQYLDSTFLGCLVALHKRCGHPPNARFSIVADQPTRERLLTCTGLHRILNITDRLPVGTICWTPIPVCSPDAREFKQHVMQCHQNLAQCNGPQSATFQRITEQLQRELEPRQS